MGYAVYGDAILANIGSTWDSEGKCVYGDVTLNNYHRTPRGAYKLSRQAVAVADLPSTYSCQSQWQDSTLENAALQEETSIDCTDEDKSDQGDATLFASTNGLEKTELENLLEGQHEFEFELGADGRFPLEYMVKPIKGVWSFGRGCRSGDLFNSLLKEPSSLRQIMGVDISQKTLIRAAKALQRTLTTQKPGHSCPLESLQKLSLYEGSITDMDPQLHAPDVATCIESQLPTWSITPFSEACNGTLQPAVHVVWVFLQEIQKPTCPKTWTIQQNNRFQILQNPELMSTDLSAHGLSFENGIPRLLQGLTMRVTSEFTFHSGVCTHSDQQNMNYETSPKVIADPFTFKELWHWTTPRSSEATACCSNMENLSIYQADEECITCS
ncbi:unnamed protein product [Sphagnum jensenii]|uniref:Small RNA 2'-O-methyltransferase n=1 Tax=Sphagnum jensenii TaxID=128206 RepID=A0ABP0XKM4_9BRYO